MAKGAYKRTPEIIAKQNKKKHTSIPTKANTSGIKFFVCRPDKVKVKTNGRVYVYDSIFCEAKIMHENKVYYVYRGRNRAKAEEFANKISELIDAGGIDLFLKWYWHKELKGEQNG